MNSLGERIKELRKKAKMSQKELALKVGVEGGSLGNWERDNREPAISYLREINEVLKPTLGDNLFYLVTGEQPESYLNALTINSKYIARETVLQRTEEFLTEMDMLREIRLVGKLDELLKVYSESVLAADSINNGHGVASGS